MCAIDQSQAPGCNANEPWQIGSKPDGRTLQGLYDMSGNLSEWVQDTYHPDYEGAPLDGTAWCEEACVGEPENTPRVVRGGSWKTIQSSRLRTASRQSANGSVGSVNIGGRLARSLRSTPSISQP